MKMFFSLLFYLQMSGSVAQASQGVEVAFLEMRSPQGKLIQLENGGRFAHIAIAYQNGWLHAHSWRGVEWISTEDLQKMSFHFEVVELPHRESLSAAVVEKYLGKKYDVNFDWSNEAIYCSELVAKILHIEPQSMEMDSKHWPARFHKQRGQWGISPDDLYIILKKERRWSESLQCQRLFSSR